MSRADLSTGQPRLTLTGVGGIGKTRLALQVAGALIAQYADGVWVVSFAAVSDPALVPQTIAAVLKVREEPNRPLQDTLLKYLQPTEMLLILDNCEHLVPAIATLVDAVLHRCPRITLLVTSREGLNISGETTYTIPTLTVPNSQRLLDLDQLAQFDAVRLFIDRAVAIQPEFTITHANAPAIAQICSRLDGIPLAIELAAARVRVLVPETIAERLDRLFQLLTGGSRSAVARHQTLRALIDWSHDLLTEAERTVLHRCAVFAGGWTLDTVEQVCGMQEIPADDVLDRLETLVRKSLVVVETDTETDQIRYRLLEPIRQYAQEKLVESGRDEQTRHRHATFFLQLVEQEMEIEVRYTRFEREHPNIRTAFAWFLETEPATGLRMVRHLAPFWFQRGYQREGSAWLTQLLARSSHLLTSDRVHALGWAGWLEMMSGRFDATASHFEDGLTLARHVDDAGELLWLLYLNIALKACVFGLLDQGEALLEEYQTLVHTTMNNHAIRTAAFLQGILAHQHGQYAQAQTAHEHARALDHQTNQYTQNPLDYFYGFTLVQLGDYERARSIFQASLMNLHTLHWLGGTAACLEGYALLEARQSSYVRAAWMLGAADRYRTDAGEVRTFIIERNNYDTATALARAQLGAARFDQEWNLGQSIPPGELFVEMIETQHQEHSNE